ncbi:MAG: phosphonate C-P lyase system protein PhnG [Clostridiales Family XIII bacterium]|jgi:alpha-D-ribose 1-methylphosphonate 5-triphosphate synthase subunit PhnG|nr:phosphonate C-P lyase system protein PhnG [Clostridiales Family XIII bacterium]
MDKKRLTKILARADRREVAAMSAEILKTCRPVILKEPGKTLAMIKMREPVKQSLFYIGEVIVCEASVEIDGARGIAVLMGDDAEKTLDMAIIDAAVNKGLFEGESKLLELEREQNAEIMRENALFLKTMVNFESMDGEAPNDLNAFKKA